MKKLAIGNYAIARGAFEAGVRVSSAYPGTPSTEVTECLAKYEEILCEWSPNEKVALEVGIGASIGGARAIVAMKHVGLNVAADPLFTASYTGVTGGLVLVVADDPSIHSSQNEQDSRYYALSAKLPMIEPSDSAEALSFTKLAFEMSEKYDTPIIVRLTTRVAHSQSYIEESARVNSDIKPYIKNTSKYVMMPANAKARRFDVENRMVKMLSDSIDMPINKEELLSKEIGIVCAGGVYQYVKEALPEYSVYKVGLINPLPIEGIRNFSKKVKKLIVIEELDGFIENQLKANGIVAEGKNIFNNYGELSVSIIQNKLLGKDIIKSDIAVVPRPPVLCPGCPHRGVFYAINRLKLNVMGDIGCYTLGALAPLNAVDAVVCMGASIGMAIGVEKAQGREFAKKTLAVIGDSTFVHSGITGMIDAVYNNLNTKILILDNSTTGMTGHQEHPGTGRTIYNQPTYKLSFEELAKACGVKNIAVVNAYNIGEVEKVIKEQMSLDGVSLIIAKEPCALLDKTKHKPYKISDKCTNCKMCIKLGCPAIVNHQNGPVIDSTMCTGCRVCANVCKFTAIVEEK